MIMYRVYSNSVLFLDTLVNRKIYAISYYWRVFTHKYFTTSNSYNVKNPLTASKMSGS